MKMVPQMILNRLRRVGHGHLGSFPASLLLTAALLWTPASVNAQLISWESPFDGIWDLSSNWTPLNVPDSPGEVGVLPSLGASYRVTLDTSVALDGIDILSPDAVLDFSGSHTMTLFDSRGLEVHGKLFVNRGATLFGFLRIFSGGEVAIDAGRVFTIDRDVLNDGLIEINPLGNFANAMIVFTSDLEFAGAGEVRLTTGGSTGDAQLGLVGGPTLTNRFGHLIHGDGTIGGPFLNEGVIAGDVSGRVLALTGDTAENHGEIAALVGGFVELSGSSLVQIDPGRVVADGGTVSLIAGAEIFGGTLATLAGGVIECVGGTERLSDIRLEGELHLKPASTVVLGGSLFANEGVVRVNSEATFANTNLQVDGNVTFVGAGSIVLATDGSFADASLLTLVDSHLTNGLDHTIEGSGEINASLTNDGWVTANDIHGLRIFGEDVVNTGIFESLGSLLRIEMRVDQFGAGEIAARGGTVEFSGTARVVGGTVYADPDGLVSVVSPGATFQDLTLDGDIQVEPGVSLSLEGSIQNEGRLLINKNFTANSTLLIAADASLSGIGTVELLADVSTGDAQVRCADAVTLTIESGQKIHGSGWLTGANFINFGEVVADVANRDLELGVDSFINENLLLATNGGRILVRAPILQGETGAIIPDGGVVELDTSSRVEGGQLGAKGGIVLAIGSSTTLVDVFIEGKLGILQGKRLRLEGTIENNGLIEVNRDCGNANSILEIEGAVHLSGEGQIQLLTAGSSGDAQIVGTANPVSVLTNGAKHTIRGWGEVHVETVNEGLISGDSSEELIFLGPLWNRGTVKATGRTTVDVREFGAEGMTGTWVVEPRAELILPSAIATLPARLELDGSRAMLLLSNDSYALQSLSQIDVPGALVLGGGRGEIFADVFTVEGRLELGIEASLYITGGSEAVYRQVETGTLATTLLDPIHQGLAILSEGRVELAGALSVDVISEHKIVDGDRWSLLGARSILGEFSSIANATGDPSITFDAEVDSSGGFETLYLVASVVPAPTSESPEDSTEDTNDSGDDVLEEDTTDRFPIAPSLRTRTQNSGILVSLELPERAMVRLAVFDITGRQVASVVPRSVPAGGIEIAVDGPHWSGLYFVKAWILEDRGRRETLTSRVLVTR